MMTPKTPNTPKTPKGLKDGGKGKLKRDRAGTIEESESYKKPRRSDRLSLSATNPIANNQHLPSPVTNQESVSSAECYKEATLTPPPVGKPNGIERPRTPDGGNGDVVPRSLLISSPPQDTQERSQFTYETRALTDDVKDEEEEGVWGYLMPLDHKYGKSLVLRTRGACPIADESLDITKIKKRKDPAGEEAEFEDSKIEGIASRGYLIGRHPECDLILQDPIVSNRHCLLFTENKAGQTVAVVEDLSSNGTFVNESLLGRNKRRQLKDGDEISVMDNGPRFAFRYPKHRETSGFLQKYTLLEMLGKGHFAEVFLCVEKATGQRFAVKVFTKQPGVEERSKTEGLQQEIAVLMGVSHPNILCLKDTFDERNAVFLVLELAPEGELFNWIIMKSKLTEDETRKVFIQLFEGVKYLHERGIVHRDIKPENILLTDKNLHVKVADFGLAKIIGEESFTTTLCGTPSYVAPEILENSNHRRYTRAVDVWSLGVVLYICLCGFPPFSDELYSRENPYKLTQQIKEGRFDYPSPYWDSVGDSALDLIDRMLTVDVNKRYTIDDCLAHPWTTQKPINLNDSTDGLVGGLAGLDFTKRKVTRERTLLSAINDVKITRVINIESDKDPVKVYVKNPTAKQPQNRVNNEASQPQKNGNGTKAKHEETPAEQRDPKEFMALGGKGDQELFGYDGGSNYTKEEFESKNSEESKDSVESKPKGAKPAKTSKASKKNGK